MRNLDDQARRWRGAELYRTLGRYAEGAIAVLGIMMLVITFAVVIMVKRVPGFGGAGLGT